MHFSSQFFIQTHTTEAISGNTFFAIWNKELFSNRSIQKNNVSCRKVFLAVKIYFGLEGLDYFFRFQSSFWAKFKQNTSATEDQISIQKNNY